MGVKKIRKIEDIKNLGIKNTEIVDVEFEIMVGNKKISLINRGVYRGKRENKFEMVATTNGKGTIGINVYQQYQDRLILNHSQRRVIKKNSPEFNEYILQVNQSMLI